ncbi:hypothetical protein C3L33_15340, partial [Rhododendron williamsianum]
MDLDKENFKITIVVNGIRSLLKDMSSSLVSSGCSLTRQRRCLCGDEVVLKPFGTDMNPGKVEKEIKYMREKAKSFEDKAKEYEKKAQEYEDKAKEFDNMTQVYEWKIKEMKRMERKKIKEAKTMERNFWMKLLVALLGLINTNGTFFYNGGMCVAVLLEEGSQVNELREKICGALNVNLEGKLYFYNTKRDKTKCVTLNDDNGVAMIFHVNENDVDLFESMVTDNISSHGGILALSSSSQVSNSFSQEMGLVPYLPENPNEILTGKGQLFESPDLFKQSVLLFVASNKFSFTYLDNSRAYFRLICKVAGCPWKLTAKCESSTDLVRVIMFRNEHLHNAEDASNYKLTFCSKQVGFLFKNRIVDKLNICRGIFARIPSMPSNVV